MSLFVFVAAPALASTLTVGPSGDHTTVQGAVDAASSGDVIEVAPGTYWEQVVIDQAGLTDLTITGAGGSPDQVQIKAPPGKTNAVIARGVDLVLDNLKVVAAPSSPSPPRALWLRAMDGDGAHTISLYDVVLLGTGAAGSMAISCSTSGSDTIEVTGGGVSLQNWFVGGEASCIGYTAGWDILD